MEAFGEGFPGAALPTVNSASSTLGFETRESEIRSNTDELSVLDHVVRGDLYAVV